MNAAVDSLGFVSREKLEALPPPNLARGPLAWVRENLFSSLLNTILTFVALAILYVSVPRLMKFLFINAVWTGSDRAACREETVGHPVGACWAFVWDKLNYFTYGSYPASERWRVDVFFVLSGLLVVHSWETTRARAANRGRATFEFLRRRASRILPAYWVSLIVLVPLVGASLLDHPKRLLAFATLNQYVMRSSRMKRAGAINCRSGTTHSVAPLHHAWNMSWSAISKVSSYVVATRSVESGAASARKLRM